MGKEPGCVARIVSVLRATKAGVYTGCEHTVVHGDVGHIDVDGVLIDDGTAPASGAVGVAALQSFPYALSFAIDASLPDAAERAEAC